MSPFQKDVKLKTDNNPLVISEGIQDQSKLFGNVSRKVLITFTYAAYMSCFSISMSVIDMTWPILSSHQVHCCTKKLIGATTPTQPQIVQLYG